MILQTNLHIEEANVFRRLFTIGASWGSNFLHEDISILNSPLFILGKKEIYVLRKILNKYSNK